MAFVHGKDATLSVDAVALAAYITDWSLTYDVDTAETTTIGATGDAKTYLAGMKGWNVTCSGYWDATQDAALYATFDGAVVAFSGSPDGGVTTYSGNMFVTSYNPSVSVGGANTFSANFQGTGALSRA